MSRPAPRHWKVPRSRASFWWGRQAHWLLPPGCVQSPAVPTLSSSLCAAWNPDSWRVLASVQPRAAPPCAAHSSMPAPPGLWGQAAVPVACETGDMLSRPQPSRSPFKLGGCSFKGLVLILVLGGKPAQVSFGGSGGVFESCVFFQGVPANSGTGSSSCAQRMWGTHGLEGEGGRGSSISFWSPDHYLTSALPSEANAARRARCQNVQRTRFRKSNKTPARGFFQIFI